MVQESSLRETVRAVRELEKYRDSLPVIIISYGCAPMELRHLRYFVVVAEGEAKGGRQLGGS